MKTEVRKRIENQSPSGSEFYRFWEDFGSQEPPRKRPKIVQNRTFGPLGPNARTSKAAGSQFGRFRHDLGAIVDDFGTILGHFAYDVCQLLHRPMPRGTHHSTASEKANFEEHTLMIRATRSRSIDR